MNKSVYKELRSKLNFEFKSSYFWAQLLFDVTILTCISYLFSTSWYAINILIIPLFMFRQFSILHEAVHGLTHFQSKINFIYGVIAGTFCLTPFVSWKVAHLKHHYWTGNLHKDPTFAILKNFHQSSFSKKFIIQLTWNKGIPFLGFLQHYGFVLYFLQSFWNNKKSWEYWVNLSLPLFVGTLIFLKLNWTQLFTIAAGAILYFRLFEDMIIPQHVGLYSDDSPDTHTVPWEQVEITRSWRLLSVIEKFVVLNMNYHTEHHVFPDLPWYELKKAHSLIQQKTDSETLNIITLNWMPSKRDCLFADVIQPVPTKWKKAAP